MRSLKLFKNLGYQTHLVSHEPKNDQERELLKLLLEHSDHSFLLSPEAAPDEEIDAIAGYLTGNSIGVFVPNYRKISYAAAAISSRHQPLVVVGVCHNDHESYYESLLRYQQLISVFVCASEKTRQVLQRRLNPRNSSRVAYIPHYVSLDGDFRANYTRSPFTVVYHGRLQEEQKHCSEILKVAREVVSRAENVHFKLVGDGADKKSYQASVERSGLGSRISFVESMPWSELQHELANAQMGILTSSYEGFCYGAAEALSVGLPVAAYDCGEVISDFLFHEQNGYVVDWGKADQLAQWIVQTADDEAKWQKYSESAVGVGRSKFSFDRIAAAYDVELGKAQEHCSSWPYYRPAFIPESGKSWRSLWERIGRKIGAWA
ncbi:glycosyltransferase family 4 protein [Hydrocarboniclastica marina]|uniref:glycosyltransferase family 4 protein n=1 Tax=Hydrocarboniclastica marina TaxID=2259620 RepID=UPI0015622450|nr:glycosyltransferase family 4 protein [Hydrocarboniclastica marina]